MRSRSDERVVWQEWHIPSSYQLAAFALLGDCLLVGEGEDRVEISIMSPSFPDSWLKYC